MATVKATTIVQVLTQEIPAIGEDIRIKEKVEEIAGKLENNAKSSPRYSAMMDLHDTLKPYIDNLRDHSLEEFNQLAHSLNIKPESLKLLDVTKEPKVATIVVREGGDEEEGEKKEYSPAQIEDTVQQILGTLNSILEEISSNG